MFPNKLFCFLLNRAAFSLKTFGVKVNSKKDLCNPCHSSRITSAV